MGCETCKNKNQTQNIGSGEIKNIDFMPESFVAGDFSGNFLLKVIVFGVLVIGIPFIVLALVIQVFLHFFLPKSAGKVAIKVKSFVKGLIEKWVVRKHKKEIKRREKSFGKNRSYDNDSELLDLEVYETPNDNNVMDKE
jgi:hypothetical protein